MTAEVIPFGAETVRKLRDTRNRMTARTMRAATGWPDTDTSGVDAMLNLSETARRTLLRQQFAKQGMAGPQLSEAVQEALGSLARLADAREFIATRSKASEARLEISEPDPKADLAKAFATGKIDPKMPWLLVTEYRDYDCPHTQTLPFVTVKVTGPRGQFVKPDNHWSPALTTCARGKNNTATGRKYAALAFAAMKSDKNWGLLRDISHDMAKAERKAERRAKRTNATAADKREPIRLASLRERFFAELGALIVRRLGG